MVSVIISSVLVDFPVWVCAHKIVNRYGLSFEFPFVSANIHAPTGLTPSITSLNGTLLAVMYVTGDVQMMQAFGGLLPVGIAQV